MNNDDIQKNEERLIHAAWLYYEVGLTQKQIASRMRISRATVGRMIQSAIDAGIVKIKITKTLPKQLKIEEEMINKFDLSHISIINEGTSFKSTRDMLAKSAADYLVSSLFPGCKLGLAWSNTLSLMIKYIPYQKVSENVSIHEIVGTFLDINTDFSIASRLAEKFDVPLEKLPVPVLVSNKNARDAILQEESIIRALNNAAKVSLVFVGLGSIDQDSSLIKTNYIDISKISELARRGAVGEVLFHFYDKNGKKIIAQELEERTIGIKWPEFKNIENVVAVASGTNKVKPILGALRGKIINGLITDVATAQSVLTYSMDD